MGTNLNGADLHWTSLHFAKLSNTTQIVAKWRLVWGIIYYGKDKQDLRAVDLSKADLHQARLKDANLHKADLQEAKLWGAMLTHADLRATNLNKANLRWADLTSSQLNGADLRGANLTDAKLEKADLTDALYNGDTVWPQGFDPVAAGARVSE